MPVCTRCGQDAGEPPRSGTRKLCDACRIVRTHEKKERAKLRDRQRRAAKRAERAPNAAARAQPQAARPAKRKKVETVPKNRQTLIGTVVLPSVAELGPYFKAIEYSGAHFFKQRTAWPDVLQAAHVDQTRWTVRPPTPGVAGGPPEDDDLPAALAYKSFVCANAGTDREGLLRRGLERLCFAFKRYVDDACRRPYEREVDAFLARDGGEALMAEQAAEAVAGVVGNARATAARAGNMEVANALSKALGSYRTSRVYAHEHLACPARLEVTIFRSTSEEAPRSAGPVEVRRYYEHNEACTARSVAGETYQPLADELLHWVRRMLLQSMSPSRVVELFSGDGTIDWRRLREADEEDRPPVVPVEAKRNAGRPGGGIPKAWQLDSTSVLSIKSRIRSGNGQDCGSIE